MPAQMEVFDIAGASQLHLDLVQLKHQGGVEEPTILLSGRMSRRGASRARRGPYVSKSRDF